MTDSYLSKHKTLSINKKLLQSFIHYLMVHVIALFNGCQLVLFDATTAGELYMSIYIYVISLVSLNLVLL